MRCVPDLLYSTLPACLLTLPCLPCPARLAPPAMWRDSSSTGACQFRIVGSGLIFFYFYFFLLAVVNSRQSTPEQWAMGNGHRTEFLVDGALDGWSLEGRGGVFSERFFFTYGGFFYPCHGGGLLCYAMY